MVSSYFDGDIIFCAWGSNGQPVFKDGSLSGTQGGKKAWSEKKQTF